MSRLSYSKTWRKFTSWNFILFMKEETNQTNFSFLRKPNFTIFARPYFLGFFLNCKHSECWPGLNLWTASTIRTFRKKSEESTDLTGQCHEIWKPLSIVFSLIKPIWPPDCRAKVPTYFRIWLRFREPILIKNILFLGIIDTVESNNIGPRKTRFTRWNKILN